MEGIIWPGLVLVALLVVVLARPFGIRDLRPHVRPAATYEEAVRLVAELSAADTPAISPECHTTFLSHGRRTPRVVVMFHGLTNCPAQFQMLGRTCFEQGATVLIPRLPRHGFADRMTGELARSDARELRAFTDRVVDAAYGLGGDVTIVGLSLGGSMAAWAGQNRPEVSRTVLIAPMLSPPGVPSPWSRLVTRTFAIMPNLNLWWDRKRRQDLPGPKHVYPRFATRAVTASLILGQTVLEQARHGAPACRSAAIVTVGGDRAVDNDACHALARSWRERGGREVIEYEFPDSLRLNHDVVDPDQVGANPALTYPVLLKLIGP